MTLDELAIKYGSDKSSIEHNYMGFYESTLPKEPKKLLEIGCLKGASIRIWKEWFPNTEIHCLDLFEEYPVPDIEGVRFWKGNQVDWRILEQLEKENFDVILDDASHLSRHQMMTFFGLFNGKHYYIEDLHCCEDPFFRGTLPYEATAQKFFPWNSPVISIYDCQSPIVLIKNAD